MPIAKGQPWGYPGQLPAGGVVVGSDAEAARSVTAARERAKPVPVLGLTGGDLWRTIGGGELVDPDRMRSADAMTFPVDLGRVVLDGVPLFFVAHVVAHSWTWRRTLVVLNAQWRGVWDLGPRSHPNDGLLDIYDATLTFDDLWKVRARLPTGSHLPHPRIKERRLAHFDIEFARPVAFEVDGKAMGRGRRLAADVEPDALRVVI